jgi:mannose-6-phosphate isomerase-like protein (cupin superfamily)
MTELGIRRVGQTVDVVAADGSELVLLARTDRASMAHGSLRSGAVSHAIVHRTVDEVWFVVSGAAEIWRANERGESIEAVDSGASLAIPCGTRFQYRTLGASPFCFIMTTIPAWPGDDEAIPTDGVWPT